MKHTELRPQPASAVVPPAKRPTLEQVAIAITLDNGRVAMMRFHTIGRGPAPVYGAEWLDRDNGIWKREPTDANIMQEISRTYAASAAQPIAYRIVSDDEVPQDRTFRDAWADPHLGKTRGALVHDMEKSRALHLRRIREARAPVLDQLDRDWMRATGQGRTKAAEEIEALRQELRDATTSIGIEKATTPDDLKGIWPRLVPVPKFLRKIIAPK